MGQQATRNPAPATMVGARAALRQHLEHTMLDTYFAHEKERRAQGLPPLPLNPAQTEEVCKGLEAPPEGQGALLLELLRQRVSPGVDPSAKVKAEWLDSVAKGAVNSPFVSRTDAVFMLGTMLGGYNVKPLVTYLSDKSLASAAAEALKGITLVYGAFDEVVSLSKTNAHAASVLKSWAEAEWFTKKPAFPEQLELLVFKVEGEINTDDFSPAPQAWSRPDIPLHALSMGETRFPGGNARIAELRQSGQVAFVGDVVGTGSSRKSACNSLMWHIGEDISFVPNKRRGGVVLGGLIAPIFFNTTQDSGGLPLMCDVRKVNTGDKITLDFVKGELRSESGEVLSSLEVKPATLKDEFRAGGRLNLIIGRALTLRARAALGLEETTVFAKTDNPVAAAGQGFTQAQKIVGRACGVEGILPGTACEPRMTTVGSQDTTGPMTADELKELACLEFLAPLFMQSFCHTAAYPKAADVKMHRTLPAFIVARKGVSLNPGDGVIHSWLNRLLLPDTVGTGGDSHTRFPIGISFPAGSGLVAFAGALGFMPLDMPESVLVRFHGKFNPGITLRDAVNAIPYFAQKQGLLTVAKKGKKNIFNGRILEMEGIPGLTVEQAFELTDASAERSAAAGTYALEEESVATYLRSNVALMKQMIAQGYQHADTLQRRIADCEAWLAHPVLLKRDENAVYAAVLDVDLEAITEPLLACPNDPDDVKPLSMVAGDKIDEVFIGSCMTNIGHFRAAGKLFDKEPYISTRIWITPPTTMDRSALMSEGYYNVFAGVGARVEIPGCSLCMGNQARTTPKSTVVSTSTRNFDNRLGTGSRVYLASAELAAVTAIKGVLPTPEEYQEAFAKKVAPASDSVYRYLEFDKIPGFALDYAESLRK